MSIRLSYMSKHPAPPKELTVTRSENGTLHCRLPPYPIFRVTITLCLLILLLVASLVVALPQLDARPPSVVYAVTVSAVGVALVVRLALLLREYRRPNIVEISGARLMIVEFGMERSWSLDAVRSIAFRPSDNDKGYALELRTEDLGDAVKPLFPDYAKDILRRLAALIEAELSMRKTAESSSLVDVSSRATDEQ